MTSAADLSAFQAPARRQGARAAFPQIRQGAEPVFLIFALLMVFNVALPKGGITWGDVPLTFGYMLLGALAPIALLALVNRPRGNPFAWVNFLILFFPAGIITAYKSAISAGSMVGFITYETVLIILPFLMLVAYGPFLEDLTERQIGRILKWSIAFVIIWGFLNFILYALTKNLIEIPYITVNAGDVGQIFQKNNRRGSLMKLVATYNNGNIYGICLIMLTPLYVYFTKSRVWIGLLCMTIVLTLSRSAWFGLVLCFMIMILTRQLRVANIGVWIGGGVLLALAIMVMPLIGWTANSIFDSNLGGRSYQWHDLQLSLFGENRIDIHEILYAGLLQTYGLIGALLPLAAMLFPIVYAMQRFGQLSDLRKAALAGMLSYLAIAFLDAAFVYPPVFLQYLFLAALIYRRGYRGLPVA